MTSPDHQIAVGSTFCSLHLLNSHQIITILKLFSLTINPRIVTGVGGVIYLPDPVISPKLLRIFFGTLPYLFLEIYWLQNPKRIFPISDTVYQIFVGNEGHPTPDGKNGLKHNLG